jgi:hypothetical protein
VAKQLFSSLNSLNALEKFSGVFNAKLRGRRYFKTYRQDRECTQRSNEDGVGRSNYQFMYLFINSFIRSLLYDAVGKSDICIE